MGSRRRAREAALQILYMADFSNEVSDSDFDFCCKSFDFSDEVLAFAKKIARGVIQNIQAVDKEITKASQNWSLSRMSRIDRGILRIAVYEMVFMRDIPVNVTINEAIEVAKRYGSEESKAFVNGVLDKIAVHVANQRHAA